MDTPITEVARLSSFLQDFRKFDEESRRRRLNALGSYLDQLGGDLKTLREKSAEQDRLYAPHFNVFRLLGIERDEVSLHTAFLAELLNPNGPHGQGHLFLRAFFDTAGKHEGFVPPSKPLDEHQWSVQSEVYVGGGNILDLRIESPSLRYVVVVEDKIDAGEQHDQLRRYGRWMRDARRDYQPQQLVFLTPTGRPPKSNGEFSCTCLSYRDDITAMLRICLSRVTAAPVTAIVMQYLTVIENLTSEDTDAENP